MSNDYEDVSLDGIQILVYCCEKDFVFVIGEEWYIEVISVYIECYLGLVFGVFYEIIFDLVYIDVYVVLVNDYCLYLCLVIFGMSDLLMIVFVEVDVDVLCYMELMVILLVDWLMFQDVFEDECNYWLVCLLKGMVWLLYEYDIWLGFGYIIFNGYFSEFYVLGVGFDGVIVLLLVIVLEDFVMLELEDGRIISFMSLVLLYFEEMDLKLKKGVDVLFDCFDVKQINDLIEFGCINVVKKCFGLF